MKICIRDDDLCYWSNYDVFESLYEELDIPVSISLVPFGVANHGNDMPYGNNLEKDTPRCFIDNIKMVNGLKEGIRKGKYQLLLHGYDHKYVVDDRGNYVGEMRWKEKELLNSELQKGKELLEKTFNITINTFVAPSNEIDSRGIDIISTMDMNYSGIANRIKDRKISIRFLFALLRRHISKILYGIPLCGLIKYKDHREHGIIPLGNINAMKKYLKVCYNHNWNMIIVVHYWQLSQDNERKETLKDFIQLAKNSGIEFGFVNDCFF